MLDDILGPLVLYDLYDGEVELLSANEHYCQLNGVNAVDLHEPRSTFARRAFESDWDEVMEAFEQARENVPNGAVVVVRRMCPDRSTAHLLVHLLFLREHEGHYLYLGSLRDVTRERQQARQLESSRRALSAATDASPRDPLLVALGEENRRTALALSAELSPGGMIGGYCEPEFPLYFANAAMVELLGYDTYEELAAGIDWRVGNTIHPDDLASVALDFGLSTTWGSSNIHHTAWLARTGRGSGRSTKAGWSKRKTVGLPWRALAPTSPKSWRCNGSY